MVNLKKKLKQLAGKTGLDEVDDLASSARAWLAKNAPSAVSGLSALSELGERTTPAGIAQLTQESVQRRDPMHFLRPFELSKAAGQGLVEEPVLSGLNTALGIEGGGSSPWSGRQRKATSAAIDEIDNDLLRTTARAGLKGLDVATDPSTYLPGIGWVGKGTGVGGAATRAGLFGAGAEAAGAAGEALGGEKGRFAGEVLGGPLALRGAGASGLLGVTDDAAKASPLRSRLKEMAAAPQEGEVSLHAGVPLKEGLRAFAQHGKPLGTIAGATTGYSTWDEDDSYWDKALKVAAGGAAGYVAGTTLKGATTPRPQRDVAFLTQDISERLDDIGKDVIAMRQTTGGPLALIGAMRRTFRSGSISSHQVKGSVDQLGEVVEQAFRDGHIIPTTTGAADVARLRAWVAANKTKLSPTLRQRWEDTSSVPSEFILDHWNDRTTGAANFQVMLSAPKEVHDAVAGLQGFWKKVADTESALGVPHQSLIDDYLPRAYRRADEAPRKGPGGSRLNSRQGPWHEREIPTMLEALERTEKPLLPAWETVGDLFEYRLRAGTRAMAHAEVLNTLKRKGWIRYGAKAPGDNYERLNEDMLRQIFPTLDTDEAKRIFNDFEAGALIAGDLGMGNSPAARAEGLRQMRAQQGTMFSYPWVREDVADELKVALRAAFGETELTDSRSWQALQGFISHLKGTRLAADIAMLGREAATLTAAQATAGGVRSTLNPVAWARASSGIWRAFETAVTRGGIDDYLRDPDNRRWANMIGISGRGSENPILGYEQGQYGLARLPKIGKYAGKLEEWQFNHLIPAMQIESAKEVAKHLSRSMPAAEAERIAADFIRKATGNVDLVALGHGPTLREWERAGMLSTGWTHGMLGLITGTVKGGREGQLYRRFWAGTALASVATAAGLSVLLTGDASPEHLWELLDPMGQDSVTNPNGRGFLKVEMPDGIRVDLWGPLTPIFRAITSPVATGAQEFQRAPNKDSAEGLWWAAWAGLKGAAGIAGEGRGAIDTIPRWFESRRSMPIGILMDLKANRDYRGRMIADEDTEQGNWLDRAKFVLGQLPPGISESAGFTTEQSPTPDLAFGSRSTITRGIGSALGLNVSTPQRDPAPIKAKVEEFLRSQGTHGGLDPIGKLKRAEDVDTAAKQRFLAENPEVRSYIQQKRRESAKGLGVPVGKEAARLYNAQTEELRIERDQTIRQLGELRRTNQISGNEYRDRVSEAWDRYVFGKDALAESILGVDSPEAAQKKLEGFYGKRTAENDMDLLLNKWYSIRPADDSRAARDAAAQERTAFVEGLDPATKQRFLEYRRNTAKSVGGDVYAAYFDAQQVYGEYAKISPYIGMDVAQARKVQDLLERARQRRHMTGLPQGAAIMLDGQADITTKVLAQRAQGGKLSNPLRQQFWRQHADKLGPFYTDIISEMAEDMAG